MHYSQAFNQSYQFKYQQFSPLLLKIANRGHYQFINMINLAKFLSKQTSNLYTKNSKFLLSTTSNFRKFIDQTLHNQNYSYHIVKSKSHSIHLNLALEQYFFEHCNMQRPMLLIYKNDKTIVIGKHQNAWKECHVQQMEKANVELCRRKSGGGAVYQDLGNICFSFHMNSLQKNDDFKTYNNTLIIDSLTQLGINASASGRNDLVADDLYKISGSAYKLKFKNQRVKALHHGTLLIDVDLKALGSYLNPNKLKLQSKGIQSVVSRVKNLKELKPDFSQEKFVNSLIAKVHQKNQSQKDAKQVYECQFNEQQILSHPKIKQIYDHSKSWDFVWGKTPEFTHELEHKFDWAYNNFMLKVKENKIISGKVWSDCLVPGFIDKFNQVLQVKIKDLDIEYSVKGMENFFQIMRKEINQTEIQGISEEMSEAWLAQLEQWLKKSI